MSVLIKDMQIPDNCCQCMISGFRTAIKCTEWTEISAGRRENERVWSCPLVELPEHHGRLIDADKMKQWFFRPYSNEESYSNLDIARIIDSQATIVEAE